MAKLHFETLYQFYRFIIFYSGSRLREVQSNYRRFQEIFILDMNFPLDG